MANDKDWVKRGKLFHQRGEYDQAIDSFKRALNLNPEQDIKKDIYIRIGLSYRYKKEYDTAIDWYEKVLEIDDQDPLAWNNIGYAYECKNQREKAKEMYKKSLELDPTYELALVNLLKLYKENEEFENAKKLLKDALEEDPVNADNWVDLGLVYNEMGEYEKSIAAYEKALLYEPSRVAFNNIGWTYYNQEDFKNAIYAFKESLKRDWRYDLPYSNLHKIYNYFLDNNVEDCELWKDLADAYFVARDYKYALTACNRCLYINPDYGGMEGLKDEILQAKEKVEMKSKLESTIESAFFTYSKIASSVLWNDVIGYVKYKAPELEYTNSEIKYTIIEFINKNGLNIQLNDKRLIMLKEDLAHDQKLII
ncbi:MAG: hypothetical protein BAJALOKI2v1_280013 [Promethearchaeota archaeon]|nr:MAG: hypothetical protein BAJALOKI2v1_280013 [Candidatus Lokiarchaeota archaeon]